MLRRGSAGEEPDCGGKRQVEERPDRHAAAAGMDEERIVAEAMGEVGDLVFEQAEVIPGIVVLEVDDAFGGEDELMKGLCP
ncbi:MAG: hypothetical protein AMXMBFR20_23710 [Planctomycetia bacterium]